MAVRDSTTSKRYPAAFELNGLTWTAAASADSVVYTTEIEGEDIEFMSYIATQEGGAWYHESLAKQVQLLDSEGKPTAEIQIGTKASTPFWTVWPAPCFLRLRQPRCL